MTKEPVTVASSYLDAVAQSYVQELHRNGQHILPHREIIRDERGRPVPEHKECPGPAWPFSLFTDAAEAAMDRVKTGLHDHASKNATETRTAQTAADYALRHVPRPLPTPEARSRGLGQPLAVPDVGTASLDAGCIPDPGDFVWYGDTTGPARPLDGREAGRWADDGGRLVPGVVHAGADDEAADESPAQAQAARARLISAVRRARGVPATARPSRADAGGETIAGGADEGIRPSPTSARLYNWLASFTGRRPVEVCDRCGFLTAFDRDADSYQCVHCGAHHLLDAEAKEIDLLDRTCVTCGHVHDDAFPFITEESGPATGVYRTSVPYCEACGSEDGSKLDQIQCRECGFLHYDGWEEDWESGESVFEPSLFVMHSCKNCGAAREY